MNDHLIIFLIKLEGYRLELREMAKNINQNRNTVNIIINVGNKINDDILSLANIKDFELDKLEKLDEVKKYIKDMKLLRYLAIGIVEKNIDITFDENQKKSYKLFFEHMKSELKAFTIFKFENLNKQLADTENIYKLVKFGKPNSNISYELLEVMFQDFEFGEAEKASVYNYINQINAKKETNIR